MKVNYDVEGDIFNIQRFSLNDGPGIRTIVFLKGCPFTCWWCSNPESQKKRPVVMYNEDDCLFCRRCEAACKGGRITFDAAGKHHLDQEHCSGCGEGVQACPAGALVLKGRKMSVAALVKELKKDSSTFRHSGGGITLSGGDPLTQPEFSEELLKACKAQGWSTAMETEGGVVNPEAIEQIFPYVDHVLLDIKHMDPEKHRKFTGQTNEAVLDNARRIARISSVTVRVPVIPGFNHSKEEIQAIAEFASTLPGIVGVHLLPYHSLGENKYKMLGMEYKMNRLQAKSLHEEDLEAYRPVIEAFGIKCLIGEKK